MEGRVEPSESAPISATASTDAQGPVSPAVGRRRKSPHLMCGSRFWGVAAAVGCFYFAYSSYSRLRDGDFSWVHDSWSLVTYAVWIIFVLALLSESRCWRERIFFGLVFASFTLGFVLSAWTSAPNSAVRDSRKIALVIWILAAIASLTTVRKVPQIGAPAETEGGKS